MRTQRAARAAELGALVPALARCRAARAPLQERADEVRRLADLAGGRRGERAADDAVVLRARRPARGGRGRRERAAAAHVAGPLLPRPHRRRPRRGPLRPRPARPRHLDRAGPRHRTLSGGETFLASLALALGLADVVTAEAGGARIEALFVDEGFGTLDEQTLDEVMDVLDGLREGGRVVGLVSHVAELRQRIPAQVRVHKGRRGSTVTTTGC